jgi:UDP-N-acetylmuramoyl-L-alanyl-D-glutamate--2,6-diaminopimelate ligase
MNSLKKTLKKVIPASLYQSIEPTYHLLTATAAATKAGYPAHNMRVIGVTGTNGKTSTCFMIHKMLTEAGLKAGLMTTVAYGVGNDITPQVAHMTTVSAPLLQKRLAEFKKQNVEWIVLEVTSHALAQHRTFGVPIEIAVMTNVTHEHLDYHRTFERYLAAKTKLFKLASRVGIINADDPSAETFRQAVKQSVSYGLKSGDWRAQDINLSAHGSDYTALIDGDSYHIHVNIPGEFNVYNSLAAAAVGREVGLTKDQIERGIAALAGVEGRMTVVDAGQPFSAIVDFAHTPDSFERLLNDVRNTTKGKLVVLFGSAGRRDEAKRAIQGEIAGKYADEIVLTEEDDRDIDGNTILSQIASGAEKAGKKREENLFLVPDRTAAINFAVSRVSSSKDTVIFLGKGHEKTIERADGAHPWNEIETVRQAILKRLSSDD